MNDSPISIKPVLGNPDVIRVLEQALAAAKAGTVQGVTVVCAMGGDGISIQMGGTNPATLIAGCQQATRQLLDAMFSQKPRSSIVMPQRRM